MAGDLTKDSDRLLAEGRTLLRDNREGGRHRRATALSIGKGSAEIKAKHLANKVVRIAVAAAAIFVGVTIVGIVIDGIGFAGIVFTFLAIVAAVLGLAVFPRLKVPRRAELNQGDARNLVGRTELWLEAQRPALPPPAVTLVDQIGVQLDALGLQLQGIDQEHPSTREVRKLVGEHLPEMIDAYRKIPAHLRKEANAGTTPDQRLVEGLGKVSDEIDSITRQLAQGSIDDLAIRTRYLDYRYGEAEEIAPKAD